MSNYEWVCTSCWIVRRGNNQSCCGETIPFDPVVHCTKLISGSNAWRIVEKKWRNHPFFQKVADDLSRDGCQSLPVAINEAIEQLIDFYEAQNEGV